MTLVQTLAATATTAATSDAVWMAPTELGMVDWAFDKNVLHCDRMQQRIENMETSAFLTSHPKMMNAFEWWVNYFHFKRDCTEEQPTEDDDQTVVLSDLSWAAPTELGMVDWAFDKNILHCDRMQDRIWNWEHSSFISTHPKILHALQSFINWTGLQRDCTGDHVPVDVVTDLLASWMAPTQLSMVDWAFDKNILHCSKMQERIMRMENGPYLTSHPKMMHAFEWMVNYFNFKRDCTESSPAEDADQIFASADFSWAAPTQLAMMDFAYDNGMFSCPKMQERVARWESSHFLRSHPKIAMMVDNFLTKHRFKKDCDDHSELIDDSYVEPDFETLVELVEDELHGDGSQKKVFNAEQGFVGMKLDDAMEGGTCVFYVHGIYMVPIPLTHVDYTVYDAEGNVFNMYSNDSVKHGKAHQFAEYSFEHPCSEIYGPGYSYEINAYITSGLFKRVDHKIWSLSGHNDEEADQDLSDDETDYDYDDEEDYDDEDYDTEQE